ncbi:YrdB family protein [Chitinophaga polysaccharea]|uniref:YrdB family protein n=1 Tax=Chitinophaga polysaccharea TaxID=1293035 RepID=UPI0014558E04|nr:YrdB family protein [Chitinophaga polysaccharea]NLR59092.1 YrdB family protein [Chitinophaga polysaccharea]
MNTNPVNLAVRFLLEIIMLVILGLWGWQMGADSWLRYVLALGFPLSAATLWGVFRIPNDPKEAPVAIPGQARLLLEWILFGLAVWGLRVMEHPQWSIILAAVVIVHYIVSYDRTWDMLRNKPYNGFAERR